MISEIIKNSGNNLEDYLNIIKIIFIFVITYLTNYKIENKKEKNNFIMFSKLFFIVIISISCAFVKIRLGYVISIVSWILLIILIYEKENIKKSLLITLFSLSLNYVIIFISIVFTFFINMLFSLKTNNINLILIIIIHITLLNCFFSIKKFKYGIVSLKKYKPNEYVDILILTIVAMILLTFIILPYADMILVERIILVFLLFIIIMFITIQKSLQLYYKQQMLIKDLKETKEELENKKKEIAELEEENIRISKKNHTIVHKQKSIEYKLEELLMKTEISIEEAGEVKERLEKLHNQIYSEKENIELDKTGISNIDDMLKYMQSECIENKIEFTLVLKGNIHYMVNNLISKEDLETLLADHIKDAIIAINHTDNINKSVLVKLGNIDETYSLYIYDSGVEFKKEVLENLGKKPYTTHKDEGGTGMGFMNTFDTLRKCKASLIIEEFNKPCSDNYTKVIEIKFDNKNNFIVKSYQGIKIDNIIR